MGASRRKLAPRSRSPNSPGACVTRVRRAPGATGRRRSRDRRGLPSRTISDLLVEVDLRAVVQRRCDEVRSALDRDVFFHFLLGRSDARHEPGARGGIDPKVGRKVGKLELGESLCGCVGRDGKRIVAECIRAVFEELRTRAWTGEFENYRVGKDGPRRRIAWANTTVHDAEGKVEFEIGRGIHVTEHRVAEERTRKSLREKEVLLREPYHRVENTLQVVSSLLRLQSGVLREPEAPKALAESRGRIQSMAPIHEELYRSSDLANTDFGEYVDSLVPDVVRASLGTQGRIKVDARGDDLTMDTDTAIPCGLMLNGLLSNALGRAFPQGRSGAIEVSFRRMDGDLVELAVRDDGAGCPVQPDFRATESLGLRLVVTLAESRFRGKVDLDRSRGTEFLIRFPYQPRHVETSR